MAWCSVSYAVEPTLANLSRWSAYYIYKREEFMKGANVGGFEELILLAVEALGDNAYGVTVQELAEQNAKRAVSLGAVYAALDRLETKKFLKSRVEAGGDYRGGRSRRHFVTTAEGRAALAEIKCQRDAMWRLIASASRRRT